MLIYFAIYLTCNEISELFSVRTVVSLAHEQPLYNNISSEKKQAYMSALAAGHKTTLQKDDKTRLSYNLQCKNKTKSSDLKPKCFTV